MDIDADNDAEPEPDPAPLGGGRGVAWLSAVVFVVVCSSGGVVSVMAGGGELFTGRWWLVTGVYFVVAVAAGTGLGLVLRRSLGWQSSAWAARRKQLSWRERLQIGWATGRVRALEDPTLAQGAVERSEFGLRAMARMAQWYVLAARLATGLVMLFALGLLGLAGYGWDGGKGGDWLVVGMAVALAGLATVLPTLYRRVWHWSTQRARRALDANRAVVVRVAETHEN